jgi:hypothetical protein
MMTNADNASQAQIIIIHYEWTTELFSERLIQIWFTFLTNDGYKWRLK